MQLIHDSPVEAATSCQGRSHAQSAVLGSWPCISRVYMRMHPFQAVSRFALALPSLQLWTIFNGFFKASRGQKGGHGGGLGELVGRVTCTWRVGSRHDACRHWWVACSVCVLGHPAAIPNLLLVH